MGPKPSRLPIRPVIAIAGVLAALAVALVVSHALPAGTSPERDRPSSAATARRTVDVAGNAPAVTRAVPPVVPRDHDVNGDGRDDAVVRVAAGAFVVFGGPRHSGDVPASRLAEGGFAITGSAIDDPRIVGDVDGDGRADVAVRSGQAGAAIVFGKRDAAPVDLARDRDAVMMISGAGSWDDSAQLEPVGDADGDHRADILIPEEGEAPLAWLLRGGPRANRIDVHRSHRAVALRAAGHWADSLFVTAGIGLGDVNGDRLDDVGVIAWADLPGCEAALCEQGLWTAFGSRRLHTYRFDLDWPSRGLRSESAVRRAGTAAGFYYTGGCHCLVAAPAPIGDATGDGRGDVLASVARDEDTPGTAVLLRGRRATTAVPGRGPVRHARARNLGGWFVGLGDLDGDRLADVATSAVENDGLTILHLGPTARSRATTTMRLPNSDIRGVVATGDLDGDGIADMRIDYSESTSAIVYGSADHATINVAVDASRTLRVR
jgi:hypothetical protein